MSATHTLPTNTVNENKKKKSRKPSPSEAARQERQTRRDASRLVALKQEAARKETRAAQKELVRIRQESTRLETRATQLRAALAQNCPSSNNIAFRSRLLQAEEEIRKLNQLHAKVRLRVAKALDDQKIQYTSRSTSPNSAMASSATSRAASPSASAYAVTEELRVEILAEVTKAKAGAYEETTDPGAYNILHNSTPEGVADNFMDLVTEYAEISHQYGNLTDNVKKGISTRTEVRTTASELRDRLSKLLSSMENLTDNLDLLTPILTKTGKGIATDCRIAEESLSTLMTASRLQHATSDMEASDDRTRIQDFFSSYGQDDSVAPADPFRQSLAPSAFPAPPTIPTGTVPKKPPVSQPQRNQSHQQPTREPSPLPGAKARLLPSSVFTQAAAALLNPQFAPDHESTHINEPSFHAPNEHQQATGAGRHAHRFRGPTPPPMFTGHTTFNRAGFPPHYGRQPAGGAPGGGPPPPGPPGGPPGGGGGPPDNNGDEGDDGGSLPDLNRNPFPDRMDPFLPLIIYNVPGEQRFNTKFCKMILANTATPGELKHWLRLFQGYFEDGKGHLCTLSTQYRAVMESVDTTISNHLQPFFDEMMPVMKDRNNMAQACILEQIVAYFEMSFPRHARRTALTALKPRDYPSDSKFILAYWETAKDASYHVDSPYVQEVLVNQAIATLEDESRKEKLRLRYQDGWTLEYVAALLAKWESSTVSIDQQGRLQQGPRRQGQVHAVRSTRGSRGGNRNGRQAENNNATASPSASTPAPTSTRRSSTAPSPATTSPAQTNTGQQSNTQRKCYRCGGQHDHKTCKYIPHQCEKCGTMGHPGYHCKKSARNTGVVAMVQNSVLPSSFADAVQGAPTPRTQV